MKIDEARRAVEITFPHTEMGAETWSPALGFNAALRDWIDQVSSLFRRVEDLSEITYHGVHQDQTVVKITVTRAQFEEGLASLQDEIASHATLTVATLGSGAASDREAHREQETFKTKTYKAALASLPKSQVFVWPKLK